MRQRVAVVAWELSEKAMGTVKRSTTMKGGASHSSPIPMGSLDEPLLQHRYLERLHWKSAQMELDVSDSDDEKDRVADKALPPSGSVRNRMKVSPRWNVFILVEGSVVSAYRARPSTLFGEQFASFKRTGVSRYAGRTHEGLCNN